MSETVHAVPFVILSALMIGGTVGVLFSRNVVHAAFWLLGVMVAGAGMFLLLSAEFLALVQILVYAGAVAVLLLFTIMLTLRRREDAVRDLDLSPSGALAALAFCVTLVYAIGTTSVETAQMPDVVPDTAAFGLKLYDLTDGWVLPFEIASLVLLVALVAAVWWSREGDDE